MSSVRIKIKPIKEKPYCYINNYRFSTHKDINAKKRNLTKKETELIESIFPDKHKEIIYNNSGNIRYKILFFDNKNRDITMSMVEQLREVMESNKTAKEYYQYLCNNPRVAYEIFKIAI